MSEPRKLKATVWVNGERYRVNIERDLDEGGFVAQCVELPGALTQGETLVEVLDNSEDAIKCVLNHLATKGDPDV